MPRSGLRTRAQRDRFQRHAALWHRGFNAEAAAKVELDIPTDWARTKRKDLRRANTKANDKDAQS